MNSDRGTHTARRKPSVCPKCGRVDALICRCDEGTRTAQEPLRSAVFAVDLRHETNDLNATVECIALSGSGAKRTALKMMAAGSWVVVGHRKVRDFKPRIPA